MRERITQAGESIGTSIIWGVSLFTLLVFAAPLTWIGESLGDLRWHVGLLAAVLGVLGIAFLPRKRAGFACMLGLAIYNLFPAMRVYIPSTAPTFATGTEITLVQVRWEDDPTHAFEDKVNSEIADIVVVTGVSPEGRKSLKEHLLDWPYTIASPPETDDLEQDASAGPSTMVFSKIQLLEPEVITFAEDTVLLEAQIVFDGPPALLRVVNLPPPGPGDRDKDREALLRELEKRPWTLRTILAIDLGASDTSLAYGRIRNIADFTDARQGIGRQATSKASFGGFTLPVMSVPREFTFVGGEIQVIDRFSQSLRATDRERPLYRGEEHNTVTTLLRIVD